MNLGLRHAAVALVLASIFAAAPALAQTDQPEDVVRALYTEPSTAMDADHAQSYFSVDLAGAMRVRKIAPASFDYRYGAEDMQISGLQLVADIDHDQARVVAVFKNYGRANSVDWTLCRRPDGDWRIVDASSNTGPQAWDLRQLMALPAQNARC
jgi:hypothetical protein